MCWRNVKLIWFRELRDQLRDRRTLFTVVVLPMLLYPFMGISLIQVTQFFHAHRTTVWLVGHDRLPQSPQLVMNGQFNASFLNTSDTRLMDLHLSANDEEAISHRFEQFMATTSSDGFEREHLDHYIQQQMSARNVDLVMIVPETISREGSRSEESIQKQTPGEHAANQEEASDADVAVAPNVFLFVNSASDKSRIALERMESILNKWQTTLLEARLADYGLAIRNVNPIRTVQSDVAESEQRQAAAWGKVLPLLIMIWCLTGAFYPAVDLVAGEKERGTFETILSSPANRSEIAIGKLMTVIAFSMSTALLNLVSLGLTSLFVLSRVATMPGGEAFATLGPPPMHSIFWLVLAILPIAALFSAISLAAAAFARSSKEGQYYLVPLIMGSMPLMLLPMLPAARLDLGSSLIPVTNFMLLLRGVIEGNFRDVLPYTSLVLLVTMVCVVAAIRWVVHQFNSEQVLFRPSERFGLGAWVRHIFRERNTSPAFGHAMLCGIMILMTKFFMSFAVSVPGSWEEFAKQTAIVLIATVAMPAVLMAMIVSRRPREALRLNLCRPSFIAVGALLGCCFHPLFAWFGKVVLYVYPPGEGLEQMGVAMGKLIETSPSLWLLLTVFVLTPAVIEEIAYRGFILKGAESFKSPLVAILTTSLFFGAAHAVIQQSILTFGIGILLGVVAIRTNSVLPSIAFHATYNAMTALGSQWSALGLDRCSSWLIVSDASGRFEYQTMPALFVVSLGILILIWLCVVTREREGRFSQFFAVTDFLPNLAMAYRNKLDAEVSP